MHKFSKEICIDVESEGGGDDDGDGEGDGEVEEAASTTEKPECSRTPRRGELFTSDNFPRNYEKNTNCNYIMKASEGRRVQLTFFVFDVS